MKQECIFPPSYCIPLFVWLVRLENNPIPPRLTQTYVSLTPGPSTDYPHGRKESTHALAFGRWQENQFMQRSFPNAGVAAIIITNQ